MGQQKRTYSKAFKLEAIRLYEASGKSRREIEEELGISAGLLNKWRAGHRANGHQAFVGKGHQSEVDEELRRLRRENEILRQERDVLKKALVVFSRDGH
jgi:transposase